MLVLTANQAEVTKNYLQYVRLVQWVAQRMAWRHGYAADMEDEAVSFLSVLLYERWDEWDATRATRASWIVKHTRWHLGKYLRWKLSRREVPLSSLSFREHESVLSVRDDTEPEKSDAVRQVFEKLRAGVCLPRVLREKPTLSVFKEWLRSVFGWPDATINDVVREFQGLYYREPTNEVVGGSS